MRPLPLAGALCLLAVVPIACSDDDDASGACLTQVPVPAGGGQLLFFDAEAARRENLLPTSGYGADLGDPAIAEKYRSASELFGTLPFFIRSGAATLTEAPYALDDLRCSVSNVGASEGVLTTGGVPAGTDKVQVEELGEGFRLFTDAGDDAAYVEAENASPAVRELLAAADRHGMMVGYGAIDASGENGALIGLAGSERNLAVITRRTDLDDDALRQLVEGALAASELGLADGEVEVANGIAVLTATADNPADTFAAAFQRDALWFDLIADLEFPESDNAG